MKKIIIALMLITPLPALANGLFSWFEDDTRRFYVGLHANQGWFTMRDGNVLGVFGEKNWGPSQRIDDGNRASDISFSLTTGIEQRFSSHLKNIQWIFGGELFFDRINKTLIQGDQVWTWGAFGHAVEEQRRNIGEAIHSTNFLLGLRGKAGINLFDRFDIYGHIGFAYWNRSYYLHERGQGPKRHGQERWQRFPILPFIGLGTTVHITDNWAINMNYMMLLPALYDAHSDVAGVFYNYENERISVSLDVLTIGIRYHF